MYDTPPHGRKAASPLILAAIQALEIPDCDCPVDLDCPCGEACPVGPLPGCHGCVLGAGASGPLPWAGNHRACSAHCPHCNDSCDCLPAEHQPPCRHVLDAEDSPALQAWLREVLALAPTPRAARLAFVAAAVHELLASHSPEEYASPPPPPLPLLARSREGRVAELARRGPGRGEAAGRYQLFGPHDQAALDALRLTQVLERHALNGSVVYGEVVTEAERRRRIHEEGQVRCA